MILSISYVIMCGTPSMIMTISNRPPELVKLQITNGHSAMHATALDQQVTPLITSSAVP